VTTPLIVCSVGAVTPVGLTAPQTCAAIRAGVRAFRETLPQPPPEEPVVCATVPVRQRLKTTTEGWLTYLAARAIRECLAGRPIDASRVVALITLSDAYRVLSWSATGGAQFLRSIEHRLQDRFHEDSSVVCGGSAETYRVLTSARKILAGGEVRYCLVGGVDSLVNEADVARLASGGRLHAGAANPQGVIPGEGAAFVLLSREAHGTGSVPLGQILGMGWAEDQNHVLTERYSTGAATTRALAAALRDAGRTEPNIDLRVSDMNGERYRAWESMLSTTRFYRTHRDQLPTWYAAASVGDTGAAAGALGIVLTCVGMARGYAPGPLAMLEAASDEGLRSACVVSSAPDAPTPPFRTAA
jgi:3-oxoacyl-[acyl-carrier-protein] synthase I